MSQRTICDGCGATIPDALPLLTQEEAAGGALVQGRARLGEPGDGLARQLELRFGLHAMKLDLCTTCHPRVRAVLAEALPELGRTRADWWSRMGVEGVPRTSSATSPGEVVAGSRVELRSGGPSMTVVEVRTPGKNTDVPDTSDVVAWWRAEDGTPQIVEFDTRCVRSVG